MGELAEVPAANSGRDLVTLPNIGRVQNKSVSKLIIFPPLPPKVPEIGRRRGVGARPFVRVTLGQLSGGVLLTSLVGLPLRSKSHRRG